MFMAKPVSMETRQRMSRAHLSRKQLRFVEQYAALGNATEAARRAGYKNSSAIHTTDGRTCANLQSLPRSSRNWPRLTST